MEDYAAFEEAFSNINIKQGLRPTAINPAVLLSNVQQVESSIRPDAVTPSRSGYVFDSLMENHRPYTEVDQDHPEQPERIRRIYETLRANAVLARMKRLLSRPVTREEACLVHSYSHWNDVQAINGYTPEDFRISYNRYSPESLYVCPSTPQAAELSCGGGIEAALAVARGEVRTAFAIIRPPGHHAEPEKPMGFCFFSNIAVAARVVQRETSVKRILIVDWDVHHGNGTQRAFYDDPDVLFISVHRYDDGEWYPGGPEGAMESCGIGLGLGKNVNIPWPTGGMGDPDYLYAFTRIVLPIAYEFAPELVMISAGFDAAKGDPLGECRVTPAGFAHMTQMLGSLAGGKVVAMLEGGYNVDVISECSLAVTKVLLGDAAPMLPPMVASGLATETVYQVALVQAKYWKSVHPKALDSFEEEIKDIITIPELLKAHRSKFMFEHYKMHTVSFAISSLEASFSGQVILSPELYDCKTMVVFVHDFGNIFAEVRTELHCDLNKEHSYMVDASRHIVEWCLSNNWGLLDINVLPKPRRPIFKGDTATMKQVICYLWDNYIELSDATQVVLISHGSAGRAIVDLISARSVRRLVQAVVQVASVHEPVPLPVISEDLKEWFKKRSYLAVPSAHPTLLTKARLLERRYEMVKILPEERVTQLFVDVIPEIKEFVTSHLRAPTPNPAPDTR